MTITRDNIAEEFPLPDELEAIRRTDEEIARGEVYMLDEVDWDDPKWKS